jgi:hypothetical protein
VLLQIAVGYLAFEIIGMFLVLPVAGLLGWMLKRIFFFIIDVVPARGANVQEAHAGVVNGKGVWLAIKSDRDIANWSDEDTLEFVSLMNWRGRWFFNVRERLATRIERLRDHYHITGKQPGELAKPELDAVVGDTDYKWFETAIIDQRFFNSIFAFILIASGITYLAAHP